MKIAKAVTSEYLENLLSNRFCPPAWAFLPQVRSATGYVNQVRTADAIAMGLWPSRGLELHGFEIKVYRSDWLGELKKPEKAEEIASFCDFWWIVAPKDLIKIEELPTPWGLMIPHGATTKIVKQAEKLKSSPIDALFLAAILRRAQEVVTPQSKIDKAFKEGKEEGLEERNASFEYERTHHKEFKETIDVFEKAAGIKIETWGTENIGNAVKMVLNGEHLRAKKNLKGLLATAEKIVSDIKENLGEDKTRKAENGQKRI